MQDPIRILQVLTKMNRGGAETMIMNYYRNIDRTKVQFDFLLNRKERGIFDDEIESLGGRIYRLPNIDYTKISAYLKALDKFFDEHGEYKIVHSHLNAVSVFVLRAAKNHGVPMRIAHSHTSLHTLNFNPFSTDRHGLGFLLRFTVQNLLRTKITRYANYYFSCGEKASKWLFGDKNRPQVKLVNNALDSDDFTYYRETSLKIKQALDVADKFVIGHVGNFAPEKNHAFIIKVYKEIRKLNPNSCLLLVGGFSRSDLENITGENLPEDVKVLGSRNDVPELLQAMDLFLFPSINEGLPVTLIEAQASGLKIKSSANVTRELKITELIDFIPLSKSPEYWAKSVLESYPYERQNTKKQIIAGGYDIKSKAQELQAFYLGEFRKTAEVKLRSNNS
ncbi:MAG: glycosyltransferase family 1 protein [Flavobacteriaceae bacterium]|nr:glycosyltransferase family 1 protein [Bacteroidia bacterium]NNK88862.1 glycosyltransferase family 1 protein [Flavobacteriaceae bacterium]